MRNGTPDTPERIETIRRADELYKKFEGTNEELEHLLRSRIAELEAKIEMLKVCPCARQRLQIYDNDGDHRVL